MEIEKRISTALLLWSLTLVAVCGQGFFEYGDLTPSPPPKQCIEGQEDAEAPLIRRCKNGRMETYGCIIGREKVLLGRTLRVDSALMMCKETGPGEILVVSVACLDDQGGPPHYPGTSGSTFTQHKNFRFDCVKTNKGAQAQPIGCIGDQGHTVQPGTKLVYRGTICRCIKLSDGSISISCDPGEPPATPPWQPVSEIYPHDGNTPTTISETTTTHTTWTSVDLNPTTTMYLSPVTESTTTAETTTTIAETTTQLTPPTTEWLPPLTQPPVVQPGPSSTPTSGQQTQNPMQQFFGQPGGFGGPGLVVINNM